MADKGDQKDDKMDNNEVDDNEDQKASKVGYNKLGDGVGVSGDLKNIEMGNNSVGNGKN